jgi:hypothetical protein
MGMASLERNFWSCVVSRLVLLKELMRDGDETACSTQSQR